MREYDSILQRKEKELKRELEALEMEKWIEEQYELNYERLKIEGGHALSPEVKRQGFLQILFYYRKLREVAETVSETEVKLTLPEQISPEGNKFTIEGVVDIIRENDTITMYDIKTHDAGYVNANKAYYSDQLNVYTHIWQNLRNEKLDGTAVIATQFPKSMKKAIDKDDTAKLKKELDAWNPIIDIPFSQENVEITINKFACVVDKIEKRDFSPPSINKLRERIQGTRQKFATRVCRNCDARFSCDAYRGYSAKTQSFTGSFLDYLNDLGNDDEVENATNTNAFNSEIIDIEDNI